MAAYVVEIYGGRMGMVEAASLQSAKKQAITEDGASNVVSVRKATREDIAWFLAMGGTMPVKPVKKREWKRKR